MLLIWASHSAMLTAANSLLLELPLLASSPPAHVVLVPHSHFVVFTRPQKKPHFSINNWLFRDFMICPHIWKNIWMWFVLERQAGFHSHRNTNTHTLVNWSHMIKVNWGLAEFHGQPCGEIVLLSASVSLYLRLCYHFYVLHCFPACGCRCTWCFSSVISPHTPYYVKVARQWRLMASLSL